MLVFLHMIPLKSKEYPSEELEGLPEEILSAIKPTRAARQMFFSKISTEFAKGNQQVLKELQKDALTSLKEHHAKVDSQSSLFEHFSVLEKLEEEWLHHHALLKEKESEIHLREVKLQKALESYRKALQWK